MKKTVETIFKILEAERPYTLLNAVDAEEEEDIESPCYEYDGGLDSLLGALADAVGRDDRYRNSFGTVLKTSPEALTLPQISTYLTWLVTEEKDCGGLIAGEIENGVLKRVLSRLLVLCP